MAPRQALRIEPLHADAFAPFGDVIEANGRAVQFTINEGFAQRYHDLARIDVSRSGGHPVLSIFQAQPRQTPFLARLMERHPLGSQAFMPLDGMPYLVVVAPPVDSVDTAHIRCFRATGSQGVNYAPGTWHHPLIALNQVSNFLVLDRGGPESERNQDEVDISGAGLWISQS